MPQITVEYSTALADVFDRHGFATALHQAAARLIASDLATFKSRFYPLDDAVIADGSPSNTMIHVDIAILPGRDAQTRQRLGALALECATTHFRPKPELTTQVTVEIRDLDSYHKREFTRSTTA